jgi:hypothetical protein
MDIGLRSFCKDIPPASSIYRDHHANSSPAAHRAHFTRVPADPALGYLVSSFPCHLLNGGLLRTLCGVKGAILRGKGLDAGLTARLLTSMEAGRLVVICGAGISMAPPSSLPSARAVAHAWFDEYVTATNANCEPALRDDLERLAQYFANLGGGVLGSIFIERFVPWRNFVRPPNPGHAAIADFLITGAAAGALSANFDALIERRAWDYGADFISSLDGDEATSRAAVHSPLLKFHGCSNRDRKRTVWTKSQLENDPVIADRTRKSCRWIAANLREKDLLVVGFWSDWAYLATVHHGR